MDFKFTDDNLNRIQEHTKKYPEKLSAVMPALYIGQEQNGWVSSEVIDEVAKVLEVTQEEVLGVATFYTMFHKEPKGKYHLQVCTNVSCMLRGGYEIYDAVREHLDIDNGETTEDSTFSLEEVECMGSCGTAPMIAVNEDYHENLTKEKVLEIIKALK